MLDLWFRSWFLCAFYMFGSVRFRFGKQNFNWLVLFGSGRTVKHCFGRSLVKIMIRLLLLMTLKSNVSSYWFLRNFYGNKTKGKKVWIMQGPINYLLQNLPCSLKSWLVRLFWPWPLYYCMLFNQVFYSTFALLSRNQYSSNIYVVCTAQ